jgi:hypothetical protein
LISKPSSNANTAMAEGQAQIISDW